MRDVVKGSVDQSVVIRIVDSTDGTPETGVVFNTSGIDLWYRREGATKTSITEATLSALNDAHSDGGILHIGDGYYRLDLPDAAVATGANGVAVGGTVTGMVVIGCYVPLVNWNPYDSVRGGMTALPNAAANAAGGLYISANGGLDVDLLLLTTGIDANTAAINSATIITNTNGVAGNVENIQSRLPDAVPSASEVATAVTESTAFSTMASLVDSITARIGAFTGSGVNTVLGMFQALFGRGAPAPSDIGGTFDPSTDSLEAIQEYVADIKAKSDQMQFDGNSKLICDADTVMGGYSFKANLDNINHQITVYADDRDGVAIAKASELADVKGKTEQLAFTDGRVDANAAITEEQIDDIVAGINQGIEIDPTAIADAVVAKPGADPLTTPAATAPWIQKMDWLFARFAAEMEGERSSTDRNVSTMKIYNQAGSEIGVQTITKEGLVISISKAE